MRRLPTVEQFWRAQRDPLYAVLWPTFWVTREFAADYPEWFEPWWYGRAYFMWDIDAYLYALTPLVPFLKAWDWWSRRRWFVERWLRRQGVLVAPYEGCYFREMHGHQVFK